MDKNLKRAWTKIIKADELDGHLEELGQAKVNAELCKQMLDDVSLPTNSKHLVHGCGTGQIFDFISTETFTKYKTVFADINTEYLKKLEERLIKKNITSYKTAYDDAENTSFKEKFSGILSVLLLEQIDWKKGIDNKVKLKPEVIYLIIQEQSKNVSTVTINVKSRESIRQFAQMAKPLLVPKVELKEYLKEQGYYQVKEYKIEVPNSKTMTGLIFKNVKDKSFYSHSSDYYKCLLDNGEK